MTTKRSAWRRTLLIASGLAATSLTVAACGMMTMMMNAEAPPAEQEFGLGPRHSSGGMYVASLEPAQPIAVRKMQSLNVRLTDADGRAIDGATITVDGGMPQHGHGLPTSPKVTHEHGEGVYQIDGVRFNMGGWWEFRVAIAGSAGADVVIFNLEL